MLGGGGWGEENILKDKLLRILGQYPNRLKKKALKPSMLALIQFEKLEITKLVQIIRNICVWHYTKRTEQKGPATHI